MRLWLLRHAPVSLAPGLCYGASDVPADAQQSERAAREAARDLPPDIAVVWCSALSRTWQLASQLRTLRPDLPLPKIDARLNEMDFGRWEMKRWDEIPEQAFRDWEADFAACRFGGAESVQEVIARTSAALDELQAQLGEETNALWVTHGGVIRALHFLAGGGLRRIEAMSDWPVVPVPAGSLVCLEW